MDLSSLLGPNLESPAGMSLKSLGSISHICPVKNLEEAFVNGGLLNSTICLSHSS